MCRICVLPQCRVHTRIDLFQNPAVIQACRGIGRCGATVYPERVATGRSVVGTVLVLVSVGLFVVGWRLTEQDRFFLFEAARTVGQVVGHAAFEREARKVEERFRLVVSFRLPNGDRIRFRSLASYGRPPYAVGEEVGVMYDPQQPTRARVDRRIEVLAPVVIWMGAVVLIGGLGVGIAVRGPRGDAERQTFRTPPRRR